MSRAATIFLSRYPGERAIMPPELFSMPATADLVSIHDHRLLAAHLLVFEWARDPFVGWIQLGAPFVVASLKQAREHVPPGANRVPAPDDWREVYLVTP